MFILIKPPQGQLITFHPEAENAACTHRGEEGRMPEFLAGGDVGNVHFDNRCFHGDNAVPKGNAGMRVAAGIQDDPVHFGLLDLVDQLALDIGLEIK